MRSWSKLAVLPALLIAGLVSIAAPVASEVDSGSGAVLVDFRMAPLEQVKKIHQHLQSGREAAETLTVMSWDGTGDGHHLIIDESRATPANIRTQLGRDGLDSVSWFTRPMRPGGSCDSNEECEERTDEMCEDAGHDGVNEDTVTITLHADGSKTCSGDCNSDGAVAFVTCSGN